MKTGFSQIARIVLAALLMGASVTNLHASTFNDVNWASMGGYPGANGSVRATVVDGSGKLYIGGQLTVGGQFTMAGGSLFQFGDSSVTNFPYRFYRLKSP